MNENAKPQPQITVERKRGGAVSVARCTCGQTMVSADKRRNRQIIDQWVRTHHTHNNHR